LPFKMNAISSLGWVGLAGIIFGLASLLFIRFGLLFSKIFSYLPNKPIRPIIGGIILVVVILVFKQEKMMGLGLDQIADAFITPQGYIDFFIKMILTTLTLSAGFKGGEVTPLFFIGATLGSVLIYFIPLPISLLAGLGLIALFSGATHCVISAIFLGIELYGWENTLYIVIACSVAYFFSGSKSIYENRPRDSVKKALTPYYFL
jgi:H+/Cl- antiporter ClcA